MSIADIRERLSDPGPFKPEPEDEIIICRCEEVTRGEIRRAVHDGLYQPAEIRRMLRAGMGLCQGQTCGRLLNRIVAEELGIPAAQLREAAARAPLRPVEMSIYAEERHADRIEEREKKEKAGSE